MESTSDSFLYLYRIHLACGGVSVFVFLAFLQLRGVLKPQSPLIKIIKYAALSLVILPVSGEIIFSERVVLWGACLLAAVSGGIVLKQKLRR